MQTIEQEANSTVILNDVSRIRLFETSRGDRIWILITITSRLYVVVYSGVLQVLFSRNLHYLWPSFVAEKVVVCSPKGQGAALDNKTLDT